MALRACWQEAGDRATAVCNSFTLAKALQFAIDQRAEVVNLSLGGPRDRLLERLLDVASARGIVLVAAVDADVRDGGFPASHAGSALPSPETARTICPLKMGARPRTRHSTTITGQKWGFVTGSSFAGRACLRAGRAAA